MSPRDVLDDGEPEARAFLAAREAIVDAIELLEDAALFGAGYADAVVGDHDADVAFGREERFELHAGRRAAVLVRIRDEIHERVDDGCTVDDDVREIGRDLDVEYEVLPEMRARRVGGHGVVDDVLDGLQAQLVDFSPGRHASPVEEPLDETR